MYLFGGWFAVRTRDQAAVLAAFDLSDAEPVTMRLGASLWCVAREGKVVRYYAEASPDTAVGELLDVERCFRLPHEDFPPEFFTGLGDELSEDHATRHAAYRRRREELGIPDTCYAVDLARHMSVDPSFSGRP